MKCVDDNHFSVCRRTPTIPHKGENVRKQRQECELLRIPRRTFCAQRDGSVTAPTGGARDRTPVDPS